MLKTCAMARWLLGPILHSTVHRSVSIRTPAQHLVKRFTGARASTLILLAGAMRALSIPVAGLGWRWDAQVQRPSVPSSLLRACTEHHWDNFPTCHPRLAPRPLGDLPATSRRRLTHQKTLPQLPQRQNSSTSCAAAAAGQQQQQQDSRTRCSTLSTARTPTHAAVRQQLRHGIGGNTSQRQITQKHSRTGYRAREQRAHEWVLPQPQPQ